MTITEETKKNGTTVYRASVYLGVDSVTGKKVKTTVTGRTKKEVKQKAKQAEADFIKNGSTRYKAVTVKTYKELAELWFETYQHTVKPQTFKETTFLFNRYLLPAYGHLPPEKITISMIQSLINKLSKRLVNFKVVNSLNRRILQHGVTLQVLPFNPAREIILPRPIKRESKAIKYIDNETLKKLMTYMEQIANHNYTYYFDYVLYSLLLATGCRFGEITALEWSDIDLENKTIHINKNYNRIIKQVGTTKTKTGNRIISIDQKTINLLRLYQVRQQQLFLDVGAGTPSVVFSTPTKTYQNLSTRQNSLTKRLNEIDCPRFTFHAFRHTHASLLLNAGINYKELQHRLGHSTLAMTMDTYSHLSKDKEKEAVIYYEKAINSL